ncbi:MAG: TlpA disulfide reductase family protein [Solirubrobacterales bacterium]
MSKTRATVKREPREKLPVASSGASGRKKAMTTALVAGAVLLIVVGALVAGGNEPATSASVIAPAQREPAALISGPAVGDPDKTLALADYAGEPVVVHVWASWCDVCREEAPDFAAFEKANPDVAVLGINVEDSAGEALAYKTRYGIRHATDVSDPNRDVERELGLIGQPNTLVIDSEGRIAANLPGATTKEQLESALEAL